jgi:hypothetical protein
MYSKVPYIKPKYYLNKRGAENLTLTCYDKLDNCITGYTDYTDIKDKRPVKEMLYRAWYKETREGNLRVRKYL